MTFSYIFYGFIFICIVCFFDKDCNYLMAIENGEIAEQGTHEELMKKKGIYYRLYMLQAESMKRVLQGM